MKHREKEVLFEQFEGFHLQAHLSRNNYIGFVLSLHLRSQVAIICVIYHAYCIRLSAHMRIITVHE